MLEPRRTLVFGIILLTVLLQIRTAHGTVQPPQHGKIPPGFVALTGPHGITVLVGPLQVLPTGGYEREVILPGQPPFMVSTEPGVTPQEIANTYG